MSKNNHLIEIKAKALNKYVYHTSNPIFRNKISKEGLTPKGKSETWLSDTKIDGKVIFAISGNVKDVWDSGYNDDLYRINTTKLKNKWYRDPNFVDGVYKNQRTDAIITFESIPKNSIELIYKGTGDNLDDLKKNYQKMIKLKEEVTPGNVNGMGPTSMPGADGGLPNGSGDKIHSLNGDIEDEDEDEVDESTFMKFSRFVNESNLKTSDTI